jgi:hypothetical protein
MKIQSHHYWKIKFKSKISPKNQSNGRNPKGNQPKAEDRKSASREPQVNRTKLSKIGDVAPHQLVLKNYSK